MRLIKYLLIALFTLLGMHFIIVFSSYDYLYKVLRLTVFKGKMGPSIDEFDAFANDTLQPGKTTYPWPTGVDYNTAQLPDDILQKHEELQTIAYLVIKDDSVRHEFYREGFSSNSMSNSFSMAKSIVGTLVGIAMDEGHIESLQQPASDFLPHLKETSFSVITVEDLLTMSPGINFDESYLNPFAFPAKANYGEDLKALTKKYKPVEEPGKVFSYQSGTSQLLGFLVENATGKPLHEYAREKLWEPLGAEHKALWSTDDRGNTKAFCCLNSNARDFARFGYLYLHHGKYQGRTIVDSAYVAASVTPAKNLNETFGIPNYRYGYHWWVEPDYKGMFDVFYMRGLKGQYVFVIPEKNMIIVRLGRNRQYADMDKKEYALKYEKGEKMPTSFDLPKDVEYWIDGALQVTQN